MSKGKQFELLHTFRCEPPVLEALETMTDRVWLSRSCVCERFNFRWVPGGKIDVLIDARLLDGSERDSELVCVVEIGRKAGRFSGDFRSRLTFRLLRAKDPNRHFSRFAFISIDERETIGEADGIQGAGGPQPKLSTRVIISSTDESPAGVLWEGAFPRLRWEWKHTPEGARQCVIWHASRHFGFLLAKENGEVEALANRYTVPKAGTVASINRDVERALYRLARELGWRKMTTRERVRIWGPDGAARPQWHRQEEIAELLCRAGLPATGCGQATHRAANGGDLAPEEADDLVLRYSACDDDD
jgi:hypothetical protein